MCEYVEAKCGERLNMDLHEYAHKSLQIIAKLFDWPSVAFNENDHCVLLFDNKVILNIELDAKKELLIIFSSIGEIPFEGREIMFETLLESNLFWKAKQGATIGTAKQIQTVVLESLMAFPLKIRKF
jgi:hypothetical protein